MYAQLLFYYRCEIREMISIFRAAVARDAAPFLQVCKNALEEGESSKSQRTLSGRKV
jgi:hypothetical protein